MPGENETKKLVAQEEPQPSEAQAELVALEAMPPAVQQQVRALAAKIDTANTQSIIAFGVEAQTQLAGAADQMVQRTRNKDVGPVGAALSDLMIEVRGLGVDDLKPGEKPSWFERAVLRQVHPIARFVQRYETVQSQIDALVKALEGHRGRLMTDVTLLDKLFDGTLDFFRRIELYIVAAALKLREMDDEVLPKLKARADETSDLVDAQTLRDATAQRDDLERRLHDLRLTRQVTMQSLPQIRLIQDVDKSLISKIQSSILTTIPVWKQQIALAITLWNQQKALETQRAVSDTTNEMLQRNAELLKLGSAEARREIERGIFDIETVKKVNDDLIATIQESIQIAEEGKRKRAEAQVQLQQMEAELRDTLLRARREGQL